MNKHIKVDPEELRQTLDNLYKKRKELWDREDTLSVRKELINKSNETKNTKE